MKASERWDDLDFASEVNAAIRRGPKPATQIFVFILAALLGVGVFWADRARLDEVTRGEGKVIPSSQLQVVQSLEGGIVKEILIGEGDIVQPGQILLRIDDTGVASSLGELTARNAILRTQIARLTAEALGAAAITFPEDLIVDYAETIENERTLFNARTEELEGQIDILQEQVSQRERELDELRFQERSLAGSLALAQQELQIYIPLGRSGVVSEVEVLRLRREVNDLDGQLEAARHAIPRVEASVREAVARIQDATLAFRSLARAELNERRGEMAVIQESLLAAEDRVVRTDVRSPVMGIVNKLHVATLGGVVQPGRELVEIVPLEDTLLVEGRIRPSDVAFLSPGQRAVVKITAYDYSIYGGLDGSIERISADTSTDPETGESYYRVIVRTGRNHLGSEADPLPIIPGMVASVDVLTGEKTVLEYLLKPLIKARTEALRER